MADSTPMTVEDYRHINSLPFDLAMKVYRALDAYRTTAEIRALERVRDAVLEGGGANWRTGKVRFSVWNLPRLSLAFDLARETVTPVDASEPEAGNGVGAADTSTAGARLAPAGETDPNKWNMDELR